MRFGDSCRLGFFLAVLFGFACLAEGQTYKQIYTFGQNLADGGIPGGLILSGDTLYGTTQTGGVGRHGTLYSYSLDTGVESVLHAFSGAPSDGNGPAGLFLSGSTLYVSTAFGGSANKGTISAYDLVNQSEIITSFKGDNFGPDGAAPLVPLINGGQVLYGATSGGGTSNLGTVFSYDPTSHLETSLYSFKGAPNDGGPGISSLTQIGSRLYGKSGEYAGPPGLGNPSNGTAFVLDTVTGQENLLHTFGDSSNDGVGPASSLVLIGNLLYGTTTYGGAKGNGTIYTLDPATGVEKVLYSFLGPLDGANPNGVLIWSGSLLYGTTGSGGNGNNGGTVFSFDPSTDSVAALHSFSMLSGGAFGDLVLNGNTLYGDGGGDGLFSITLPDPGSVSLLAVSTLALIRRRPRKNIRG